MMSSIDPQKLITDISNTVGMPIHEWAVIPTDKIVFDPEILNYCKTNACGNYNKSWTCPPACESMDIQKEKILLYKNVLIFTTLQNLEDTFDYEGMEEGRKFHNKLTIEIKKRLGSVPVYGAGGCPICTDKNGEPSCKYPKDCSFPEKRIYTIEAAGINVSELSKTAKISYNGGANTVTFFSMILLDKR